MSDAPDPPDEAEAAAQEIAQLRDALVTRNVIGQAQGILMERYDLSADQAFAILARASSIRNRKLRDLAVELARTRRLPQGLNPDGDGS